MSDTIPNIPFWQYLTGYEQLRSEYLNVVDSVFMSGRLILGNEVASFEKAFAAYCGVKNGVAVHSGTDALFLALKSLDIGSGDEVVTVSNTAVPTVAAIRAAGAVPVFVDVEEESGLMAVDELAAKISSCTRCIMPVHLYGQMVDMQPLMELAGSHGLAVVEDCAQACGASYRGRRAGSFGDIGAFSFYPTKILGAFGDGGMAATSDSTLSRRLLRLRFYGIESDYHAEEPGYNSRLDELQAALLNFKLARIDTAVSSRRQVARLYSEGLAGVGDIELPAVFADRDHQYHLYTIRTAQRSSLMQFLRKRGIETRINYPTPIHLMRGYEDLGCRKGELPVTERLSEMILSLPLYPEIPHEHVSSVIEAIRCYFGTGTG